MAKHNLVTDAPQQVLFNTVGLVADHAYYSVTTNELQNIVLDFVRGFVPDAQAVTWAWDNTRAKSTENGKMRLYVIFSKNSPSVTGKFGDNDIIAGETWEHSKELSEFLNRYADTSRNADGYVADFAPRKQMEYRAKDRVVGYELDLSKILVNIFDAKGVGYKEAAGTDKPVGTRIAYGELIDRNDKVCGLWVKKYSTSVRTDGENLNGVYAPRQAKSL